MLIATWMNVSIIVWATTATVAMCQKLDEVSAPITRAHPEGGSAVHIVLGSAPLPGPEARQVLGDLTKRYATHLACVGTVMEGTGFWASALQSLIISIHALANRTFKSRATTSIPEIAAWLPPHHAKRTGVMLSPRELERVLWSLRARVMETHASAQQPTRSG